MTKKVVTPVKTGVQVFCNGLEILDPGSRPPPGHVSFNRDDGKRVFSTFYWRVNLAFPNFLRPVKPVYK